eukprot:SM000084S23096  [mRNA]  locus=s84:29513:29909:- [translate_table: standard]
MQRRAVKSEPMSLSYEGQLQLLLKDGKVGTARKDGKTGEITHRTCWGGELESPEADVIQVALYGSTTVSDTLGDGKTEKVSIMRSGYSSRILEMSSVPMPDPVPPPREWQT